MRRKARTKKGNYIRVDTTKKNRKEICKSTTITTYINNLLRAKQHIARSRRNIQCQQVYKSLKKMSWRYVQLILLQKHLRISKKKCTSAAKKRTKQPIFLGKSGQNAIQFLGKSGQHKQNSMINRQLDNLIEEHYANTRNALLLSGARQVGKSYAIRKHNALVQKARG